MSKRAGAWITVGAIVVALAGCSSSGSTTLKFTDVNEGAVAYNADGTPIVATSTTPLVAGDYLKFSDVDYQGQSTTVFAHDNATCHVTSVSGAVDHGWCANVFDFANGTLSMAHATWNPESNPTTSGDITSGTGHYAGAHGTVTFSVPSGGNGNRLAVTVTYTT